MDRRILTGIAAGGQYRGFQQLYLVRMRVNSSGIGAMKWAPFSAIVASVSLTHSAAGRRVTEKAAARSRGAEDPVVLTPTLGLVRGPQ